MPSSACQKCARSEEHTSELQSHSHLVCRLLLEKKIALAAIRVIISFAPGNLPRLNEISLDFRVLFFFLMIRRPPRSTLFPYTDALPICACGAGIQVPRDVARDSRLDEVRGCKLRSEEHTSELQSHSHLVCRLLLEK